MTEGAEPKAKAAPATKKAVPAKQIAPSKGDDPQATPPEPQKAKGGNRKLPPKQPAPTIQPPPPHSRAFDALVTGDEDVVGLLAYALYKQSVREAAINGNPIDTRARDLPKATVEAFRSSAESVITFVVSSAIADATPDIQNAAIVTRIDAHHSEMIAAMGRERATIETHVTNRTAFRTAFLTSVAAWVVSLFITALILFLANQPSTEETISKIGNRSGMEASSLDPDQNAPAALPAPSPAAKEETGS